MNIKRNILFVPDKEKNKQDARLRMRITWKGGVAAFNVGFRIDFDKWVSETQRCKNNSTHGKKKIASSIINREINRYEGIVEDIFGRFESANKVPTVEEIKSEFNSAIGKGKIVVKGLFDAYNKFISEMSFNNSWSENTLKKFGTLLTHLKGFDENFTFEKLTDERMQAFIRYELSIGHQNTTIVKNISLFMWFLRWAHKNKYYTGDVHETFKPHLKGTDGNNREVIHLTWDELMAMYNTELPEGKRYLDRVRDVFCFCCFTSLRYSDVANLKKHDIKDDYFAFVSKKTSESLKIELNKYSRAILDKYKGVEIEKGLALPVISGQKTNDYLKELGKICEINEPIKKVYFAGSERIEDVKPKHELLTTHCGRRTFIVNALFLGIPAEVVMKWTGHADFQAMKPYIKIVDDLKRSEMNKFNR